MSDLDIPSSFEQSRAPIIDSRDNETNIDQSHDTHSPTGAFVRVDLDAIRANYRTYQALAPNAEIAAVVKCDGYGLGAVDIAHTLTKHEGCRHFYVANAEEGRALRNGLDAAMGSTQEGSITIYILNGPNSDTLGFYQKYALTPVLNSLPQASLWAEAFPGKSAVLHIDTGMNRLGLDPSKLSEINEIPSLPLSLIMSHLACAADDRHPMNPQQRSAFLAAANALPTAKLSLSSSGGAMIHPSYHYSQIRLGISLYGYAAQNIVDDRLRPAAQLCAPIVQVRDVKKGDYSGYDATWRANRNSRLATLAIGYGDGIPRRLSNQGNVIIEGISCPIVGRISMDLLTVDISDIPYGVSIGDHAELFGPSAPLHAIANDADTISYEILTGIGPRVKRVYKNGNTGQISE